VKKAWLLGLAIGLGAPAASVGQEQQTPVSPARREHVNMMEGVLSRAVRTGAEQVSRQMQMANPGVTLFTGQARARGFILDGYGVFFDVEIPALVQSVWWSMRTLERDLVTARAFEQLQRALSMLPDSPARVQAEQAFKQVQQLSPATRPSVQGTPAPGTVAAASEPADAADAAPPAPEAAPRAVPDPMLAAFDPQAAYTESVQRALIDAMLDYGHPIDLQPEEWLTVAARGSQGTLNPDEIYESVTIVIRIKGADLAEYIADRGKREEVRRRVQVRVF
jgi:hypothetical protein